MSVNKTASLTPEQEQMIDEIRSKWISCTLFGSPDLLIENKDKVIEAVEWLYRLCGHSADFIYVVDSPMEAQALCRRLTGEDNTFFDYSFNDLCSSSYWVAFYDYFRNIPNATDGKPIVDNEKFNKYAEFLSLGVFQAIYLKNTAVLIRHPKYIRRDDENRLHHDQLPAMEFVDGFKMHFLDGVYFTEEQFEKIKTRSMTLKEVNNLSADTRVVAFKYGLPVREMLKAMGAKLVAQGSRYDKTELFRVDNFMETEEVAYAMVMQCPTGRKDFIEWVDPEVGREAEKRKDADYAQALAYGVDPVLYSTITKENHG